MIPTRDKDYVDKEKTISVFRGSKDIYIYQRPVSYSRQINLKAVIKTKVGGVFGLGAS